jgi:hypothetical protein
VNGQSTVTVEMLERPVSDMTAGELVGVLGLLRQASGIMQPYFPPNPADVMFPPSPCDIATHAAFMAAVSRADTTAKEHWSNIWREADALCSGT